MSFKLIVVIYSVVFASAFASDQPHITEIKPLLELFKINRVIGGKNAAIGEFPHQVSLQIGYPPYMPFSHVCGGSIINERWILTAAHCVSNLPRSGQFVVKSGKNYMSIPESTEQVSFVEKIIIHHGYRGAVSPYDIAVLKLVTPLTLNKYVAPINLPEPNTLPQGKVVLSGWGSISRTAEPVLPDLLQKVTLPLIDLGKCRRALLLLGEPWAVHDTNICTGPLTGGQSACNGDSGGPLIRRTENGTNEIVGIVSWGMVPCAAIGAPAVFVRVSAFIDWINTAMNSN